MDIFRSKIGQKIVEKEVFLGKLGSSAMLMFTSIFELWLAELLCF